MNDPHLSVWQSMQRQGYSRREFLQFCTCAMAAAGIEMSNFGQVLYALEHKKRPHVIWLNFQDCMGCSESFLKSSHPVVADILLKHLSLDYTELLMAAVGKQAETSLRSTVERYPGEYIVIIEGSIPMDAGFCCIAGRSALNIAKEVIEKAAVVVAWGSCAADGGVSAAKPNPTGAQALEKVIGRDVVNVPGCPPIADVMTAVIVHLITYGSLPPLDTRGRPKVFYSRTVHDLCNRRRFYNARKFVRSWDDEGARKGYCLLKMGCRGPDTHNACASMQWNDGLSYPMKAGLGCMGCSEAGFWDKGPFSSSPRRRKN